MSRLWILAAAAILASILWAYVYGIRADNSQLRLDAVGNLALIQGQNATLKAMSRAQHATDIIMPEWSGRIESITSIAPQVAVDIQGAANDFPGCDIDMPLPRSLVLPIERMFIQARAAGADSDAGCNRTAPRTAATPRDTGTAGGI